MAQVLTAKILPPPLPPAHVTRPGLHGLLSGALERRLTTVVAGPGFGKTTALAEWTSSVRSAWYTLDRADARPRVLARGLSDALRLRLPGLATQLVRAIDADAGPDADERGRADALAALLAETLDRELSGDLVLTLDDLHEIPPGAPSTVLIEALVHQAPPGIHVVLSSREPPPFPVARLRGRGQLLELEASSLVFDVDEVAAVLAVAVGEDATALAPSVLEATEGWPAAVRLAAEALGRASPESWEDTVRGFRRPGGSVYAYLVEEVFAREPPRVAELVTRAALLDRFTPELCEAIGIRNAARTIAELSRRGLFLEPREEGWFSLGPLVRAFAEEQLRLASRERATTFRRASRWLEAEGHLEEALRCLLAAGDRRGTARLLASQGSTLLASGAVDAVIEGARSLPSELRTSEIEQLEGEARQVRGDWEGALACFGRASPEGARASSAVAWRMGLIHHLRGNIDEALATYARARTGEGSLRDDALLFAWRASAHWLRGEADLCRRLAGRALDAATESGDPATLAAAHTALALLAALEGDRRANDAHYLRALDAAERAGDVLHIIRIRTNRASHFTEEAAYEEALRELDTAISLAELTGFAPFLGLGLNNRAQARLCLGQLEEALADFEASRAVYQRIGSRMVCYPLAGAGDVYRARGDLALARAAYEEAVALGEEAGDHQGLAPALAGLARVVAPEDLETGRRYADRALGLGPGMGQVAALLAAGWVALAGGERSEASSLADRAASAARDRRDVWALAEALVLQALSSEDGDESAIRRLAEAGSIWRRIGDPIGAATVELLVARRSREGRARAERAAEELRSLGVRLGGIHAAGPLAGLDKDPPDPVRIQALGGFRLVREGAPVGVGEWQSKKARNLLKILVARRSRPVPREALMELLWPDEDPDRVSNRLSVALTTVRAVLDPGKRLPVDHFVIADGDHVALVGERVAVDVEDFLADAAAGLQAHREGRIDEALSLLRAAEVSYSGDFLEENAYDDWATPLREEARAAYVAVADALARTTAERGDHDASVRYFLRVLERDPYDEGASLGMVEALIAAGRHGEARRHYRLYRSRMEEIGVEPAPLPTSPGRGA